MSTIFLAEQFGRFGEVVNARIPRDQFQRPRGFAYISFRFPEDGEFDGPPVWLSNLSAAKAITALNNTKIAGSRVSIAYKETRINNNVPTRGFPAARSRGAPRRNSLMSRDWPPLPKAAEALAKAAVPTPSATPSPVDTPSPSTTHSPKAASTAANVAAAKPPAPAGAVSAPCRMQPDAAPGNFEASTTNPKPVTLAVSYENVSVDSLGLMTPTNALGTIKGGGEDLLTRLGLYPRPIHIDKTASRKLSLVQAINPVVLQTPAVKGIATSRVVTCVRDFVNELSHEDEEALTQLLQYPPVVHVMIVHKLRARRTVPAFKGGLA